MEITFKTDHKTGDVVFFKSGMEQVTGVISGFICVLTPAGEKVVLYKVCDGDQVYEVPMAEVK